ncbi:MAG: nucleotidyltransferase family protein [Oscillospiraceae bacterium]|nr:nucleotidyltransferase family protein [Oscillospiraceae bacterium]
MERVHQAFLNILRSALAGQPLEGSPELSPEEWARLMELARQHHLLPLVFETVHSLPELKNAPFLPPVRLQVRQQIIAQAQKSWDFLNLSRRLQAAGIPTLVVKGIICRNLYPLPDHRTSSDEDLLIPAGAFGRCHQLLTDCGMTTTESPEGLADAYEIPYRKKDGPLYIELHRHLFPPESEAYGDLNRFFEGVFDRAVEETIDGTPVRTMCPTDHLFYLVCHAFKHFLHSGFGIRQVCDIVMYANVHGSGIDWAAVLDHCREIRADRFAAAVFEIGRNHLVFDPERAHYPRQWREISVDEGPMLEDLLAGGVYGSASTSRSHSSSITLDAVAAGKQGRKTGNAVLLSLFPPAKKLEGRYPYLKDRPWLLPAAWVSRMVRYHRESRSEGGNRGAEALKIGNQRVELLREYGIIK